ncbi:RcnB family protein [Buttiauxella noackiae]|uniref:YohN family protein n=1 Tax=Buttiauxella noackiae ATCC 51607 TaxID=1354255 RepID=A0A1B7HW21_9ENTR|nr:RcnB family protein [Buttiauxella noackiae]MCA1923170.1 RcnB family protein [Buttiauxella noackiae]OAT19848.1 YohN family protein [Buttiauxella noackiae ATCC 51607]
MRKLNVFVFSAALMAGSLPLAMTAQAADAPVAAPAPAAPQPTSSFEIQEFHADYKPFKIGDIVPDLYRTKPYQIDAWQIRHLPAPVAGSHWTYMGGNYVLITDAEGKILRAMKGEIFYGH